MILAFWWWEAYPRGKCLLSFYIFSSFPFFIIPRGSVSWILAKDGRNFFNVAPAFGRSTENPRKYFSDLYPWNSWHFLTNKDVVSRSRPLPDILNSLFRPQYAVSALTSKFSSAALVVGKISMFYLFPTTSIAKEFP